MQTTNSNSAPFQYEVIRRSDCYTSDAICDQSYHCQDPRFMAPRWFTRVSSESQDQINCTSLEEQKQGEEEKEANFLEAYSSIPDNYDSYAKQKLDLAADPLEIVRSVQSMKKDTLFNQPDFEETQTNTLTSNLGRLALSESTNTSMIPTKNRLVIRKANSKSKLEVDQDSQQDKVAYEPALFYLSKNFAGIKSLTIELCEETSTMGKNHFFQVTGDDINGQPVVKKSISAKSEEKLFHNLDKNLLEYFSTKRLLSKFSHPKTLYDLLLQIHQTSPGPGKLAHKVKNGIREQIEDEPLFQQADEHFKNLIYGRNLPEYLLKGYMSTKRKKVLNATAKIKRLVKCIFARRKDLLEANQTDFVNHLRECIEAADVSIKNNAGEGAEEAFIDKMFERRQEILEQPITTAENAIKDVLDETIIESSIFKGLYLAVDREKAYDLVKKLMISRLIVMRRKEMEKENSQEEVTNEKKKKMKK